MKSTFAARLSLFVAAVALAVGVASSALAAVGVATGPFGPIQVRRGWGAVTGTVDSTSFLLRGITDGTASGRGRDTLNVIDISNWNRFPFPGQAGIASVIGTLWVTFGAGGGVTGDTLGIEPQFSIDGSNWTAVRTVAYYPTGSGTVAAVPIVFDADGHLSAATGDIGQARYMRIILAGDSAGKQTVTSIYETHYDIRQPPN